MTAVTCKTLMGDVTSAVYKAEHALDDAIREYGILERAEQAIVDSPETSEDDKATARHGAANATRILELLRKAAS